MNLYVPDTDTLTLLQTGDTAIRRNVSLHPPQNVAIAVISTTALDSFQVFTPKGLHLIAQGRERSERTLGLIVQRGGTLKAFHQLAPMCVDETPSG